MKKKAGKPAKVKQDNELVLTGGDEIGGGIGTYNSDVFHPSQKQVDYVEALSSIVTGKVTIAKVCRKAGITPKTLWKWRQTPGFEMWVSSLRMKNIKGRMFMIDQTVLNLAQGGDAKAYRTIYEKLGELRKRSDEDLEDPLSRLIEDPQKLAELFSVLQRVRFRKSVVKKEVEDEKHADESIHTERPT
jgi:hypothetical protein